MSDKLEQLVYGSTPWSAGYSVLARSEGLDEEMERGIVRHCEQYDRQQFAAPHFAYSFSLSSLSGRRLFMEIFGHWTDHVGRPSRVIRSTLIDDRSWESLSFCPFLLSWVFAPVKKWVPSKRSEVKTIPSFEPGKISIEEWQKLWHMETLAFFKTVSSLSSREKSWLHAMQQEENPFSPREFETQQDRSSLCRALLYAVPKEKRADAHCESFSLNGDSPRGICFRFSPYCSNAKGITEQGTAEMALRWKVQTIVYSLPAPFNFYVLEKLHRRKIALYKGGWLIFLLIGLLSLLSKLVHF